ncbi:hypothetical protein [Mesorhizobium sp. A623]
MMNVETNTGKFDAAVAELSPHVSTHSGYWRPWDELGPIVGEIVSSAEGTDQPDRNSVEALVDAAKLHDFWNGITDRNKNKKFDALVKVLSPKFSDGNGGQKPWSAVRPLAEKLVEWAEGGHADLWRIDALMKGARLRNLWGN